MPRKVTCEKCRGKGTVECFSCKDKDQESNHTGEHEPCTICGDTGYRKCNKCESKGYYYEED